MVAVGVIAGVVVDNKTKNKVNELYPESVLGSLFKDLKKCRHIKEEL